MVWGVPVYWIRNLQLTTYNLQLTTYNLQLTTYSLQLTTYNLQLTAYSLQLTAYSLQLTTYNLQLTAYTPYPPRITRGLFCIGWRGRAGVFVRGVSDSPVFVQRVTFSVTL